MNTEKGMESLRKGMGGSRMEGKVVDGWIDGSGRGLMGQGRGRREGKGREGDGRREGKEGGIPQS